MKRVFFSFYLFVASTILVLIFAYGPIIHRVQTRYYAKEYIQYYRDLTRGLFHVMINDMEKGDPQQWSDHVAAWQPHFGFPLALVALDETDFSTEELNQLANGLIIMQGDGDFFFRRIGGRGQVLRLGPFHEMEAVLDSKFTRAAWLGIAVFFTPFALLLAIPFWLKVKRLRTAASAFGQGDFSVRAKVSRGSSLRPVAEAFNLMADRIQNLIDGHRELTRAVSHELRSPVARVRFHLEMLANAQKRDCSCRHLAGMKKDVDELDTMISELLTYARFDGEPPPLSHQVYPLLPWLSELVVYLENEMAGKNFQLHNHIGAGDTFTARYDPRHMGRAVSNLLRNAARYSRCDISLTVECRDNQIFLSIDDDGPGIPQNERQRIFEPFARLDDSRNRDSGGYGLGLAIVKRVAEWHRGQAWVTDSDSGGASFTISWPAS